MKKSNKYLSVLLLTVIILNTMLSFSCVFAEDDTSYIIDLLYSEDYEGMEIGTLIQDWGNYNVTVQKDPKNPNNKVSKQVFASVDTSGFSKTYNIDSSKTSTGVLVLEQKLLFQSYSGARLTHSTLMRGEKNNDNFQIWDGSNDNFYGAVLENDVWYKITCPFNIDTQTFDLYVQDESGFVIKEVNNVALFNYVDLSQGIESFNERYRGVSQTGDSLYGDDFKVYRVNYDLLKEKIAKEHKEGMKSIRYYSSALQQKLNNSIVLYIDNSNAYVNNSKYRIDEDNVEVKPVIVDGRTMVPLRFIAESLGLEVQWKAANNSITIKNETRQIKMKINSNKMTVDNNEKTLDVPPCIMYDRTFVPVRAVSEIFDKYVFWDDRGIVIIGDTMGVFDIDEDLLNELYESRYFVFKPDFNVGINDELPQEEQAIRKAAFEMRNSASEVEKLAKELANMLDLTKPEFAVLKSYIETSQYTEALKAFRAFAFKELKTMDEDYWNWNFPYGYDSQMTNNKSVVDGADRLLYDVITNTSGVQMNLGVPGTINWDHNKPTLSGNPLDNTWRNTSYMFNYPLYDPLFYSFWGTGDIQYLDKWTEYMDDWCINQDNFSKILPPDVADSNNSYGVVSTFIYQMRLLAKALPESGDGFSEVTFARMFTKIVNDYMPITVSYVRSDAENWSPGHFASIVSAGLQLDKLGFKCGEFYIKAGLRRAEDYAVTQMHPDGTQTETIFGYLTEYVKYNPIVTNLMRKYRPDMVDEAWYDQQLHAVKQVADLCFHLLTPDGIFPSGFRDVLGNRSEGLKSLIGERVPSSINDDINKEILAAISNTSQGPTQFTSEWYPYSGLYFLRNSWNRGGQFGFLFCSPFPYQRQTGDNMFILNAFNQDMIVAGEVGAYDPLKSPLFVDYQKQNATKGYTNWGHRNAMISAVDEYGDLRWSSTDDYDFAEGLYDGPFFGEISDVSHNRQIHFLKELGLWIVTDRISSTQDHTYNIAWRLPVSPTGHSGRGYTPYNKDNIVIDGQSKSFKTQDANMANLSVYNFGKDYLYYAGETQSVSDSNSYKISDFYCVNTYFNGGGENVLISLMYPRETQAKEVSQISELAAENPNVTGFSTTLDNGSVIKYLAAIGDSQQLEIDGVAVNGESLLLVTDSNGKKSGIVLGSDMVSINGSQKEVGAKDFEFEMSSNDFSNVIAINTPIEPVEITPNATVFTDKLTVKMSSTAENVDIRYTTDGKEPTESSMLYNGPFEITESTLVKAKAFRRNNLTKYGCTNVSPLTTVAFTKKALLPDHNVTDVVNGLEYNYYQGDWHKEFVSLDDCTPVKTGTVSELFDTSEKETNGTYSFKYYGYIDIPADGVYSFHAPEEYIRPHIMEGYELKVIIDGEWWYPSTRRNDFGTWSIPLMKGMHKIEVEYVDYRSGREVEYNAGKQYDVIWEGTVPNLRISGPGLAEQPIPTNMLYRIR